VRQIEDEELAKLPQPDEASRPFARGRQIFEQVAQSDEFVEFLTLPAYDYID